MQIVSMMQHGSSADRKRRGYSQESTFSADLSGERVVAARRGRPLIVVALVLAGVFIFGLPRSPASYGQPVLVTPLRIGDFEGQSSKLGHAQRKRMKGRSWHRGCPVGLGKLRLLEVSHWGFDGDSHRGELVVHQRVAKRIVKVMRSLYRDRFPIRRMKLIDEYGGDDHRSMDADNTSAFNCRFVSGSPGVWSQHAYGRAIDINPVENPYVTGSHVSPPAGRPYADRSRDAKGMIKGGDHIVRAFRRAGWKWGGRWSGGTRDYQHFSGNGR
jgi:D-alanyl-D-alanine carboxypeptidase